MPKSQAWPAHALQGLGVRNLSIDLNTPGIVPILLEHHRIDAAAHADIHLGLSRKDGDHVARTGGAAAPVLLAMMDATGPADTALAALARIALPDAAALRIQRLREVVNLLGVAAPTVPLTVDVVEHRGFEYHRGVSFTLFGRGVRGELGRGGHYLAGAQFGAPVAGHRFHRVHGQCLPCNPIADAGAARVSAFRHRRDGRCRSSDGRVSHDRRTVA